MTNLQKVDEFARNAYKDVFRKLTDENMYVHAKNVADILEQAGLDADTVAAGLLHDVVEDTVVTAEDILAAFGENVARIVAGHTENKELSWEERKQYTIEELKDSTTPLEIRALIIADRLDNLRSLKKGIEEHGEEIWAKFKRGRKQQEWYFRGCLEHMSVGLSESEIPNFFYEYENEVNDFFV